MTLSHKNKGPIWQLYSVIYIVSDNPTPVELYYTVQKKYFLVVIHAINKFRCYISSYKVFIHADHSAIRYLMNKTIIEGWITIWIMLL